MRSWRVLVFAIAVATAPETLRAQEPARLSVGQRIRWRSTTDSAFWYGHVAGISHSVLIVRPRYATQDFAIPRRDLARIQAPYRMHGRSVAIDAAIGAVTGVLLTTVALADEGVGCYDVCRGPSTKVWLAGASGVLGASLGAIVGLVAPFRGWRDVKH